MAPHDGKLRREDYVDCGNLFQEWTVLIGSKDWQLYDDGARKHRYRIENLPSHKYCDGGSYELGILLPAAAGVADTTTTTTEATETTAASRSLEDHEVVAVYAGTSSHLNSALRGWGARCGHLPEDYFEEVFRAGGSVVFRCAEEEEERRGEVKERLLSAFDYAWTSGNRRRRRERRRDDDVSRVLHAYAQASPAKRRLTLAARFVVRVRNARPRCVFLARADLCSEPRFERFLRSVRDEKCRGAARSSSSGSVSSGGGGAAAESRNGGGGGGGSSSPSPQWKQQEQGEEEAWRAMVAVEVPVLPREKVRSIQDVAPEEQHDDSDGSSEDADDVDRDADRPSMRIVTITLAPPKKVPGGSSTGGAAAAAGTPSSPTSSTSSSTVCSKASSGGGMGATPKTVAADENGVRLDQALRRRLNLDDV